MSVNVLAAILASLALAAPEQPAEVAFVSRDGVYSMRADGSERRLLIAGEELSDPAWSPDGRRLAYAQGDQVRVDGQVVTHPPKGVSDSSPAWSPDGGTLAFTRYALRGERDLRTELVLLTLATAQERVLVEQPIDARLSSIAGPEFSPDGMTIAYTRHRVARAGEFDSDVLTIPVAGGPSRTLLRHAQSAVWSPDGTRLAYASIRDRNGTSCGSDECEYLGELYVAAADGTDERRLTNNPGFDGTPAWAPDGSRILFSSDQNLPGEDALEVYSVAPDGSCLTWITNGTPASAAPSLRPGSGDSFAPGSCDPGARPALGGCAGAEAVPRRALARAAPPRVAAVGHRARRRAALRRLRALQRRRLPAEHHASPASAPAATRSAGAAWRPSSIGSSAAAGPWLPSPPSGRTRACSAARRSPASGSDGAGHDGPSWTSSTPCARTRARQRPAGSPHRASRAASRHAWSEPPAWPAGSGAREPHGSCTSRRHWCARGSNSARRCGRTGSAERLNCRALREGEWRASGPRWRVSPAPCAALALVAGAKGDRQLRAWAGG